MERSATDSNGEYAITIESILSEEPEQPNPEESAAKTANALIRILFIVPHFTLLLYLNATELIDFEVLAVLVPVFVQSLTGMNCKENLWLKKHWKWTESWLRAWSESYPTIENYCTVS